MFVAGATLSFLSWSGFYAASPRRVVSKRLATIPARETVLKGLALGLALLALYPFAAGIGLERGIAVWLISLTLTGVAFAFSVQTHPRLNKRLTMASVVAAPLLLLWTIVSAV